MKEEQKITRPKTLEQVEQANDASLRRVLITCDGVGEKIKEAALEELLLRSYREGFSDGTFRQGKA